MSEAEHRYSTVPVLNPSRPEPGALESSDRDDEFATYPELDLGPLRVRVPAHAGLRMAGGETRSDAVYFDFPEGAVRLSLLAAPRTGSLWLDRADEIAEAQARIGAQVSSVWGDWGRELHIVHDGEYNWVIGVDGSRWMLLGRATWTTGSGSELIGVMRSMLRHSRVERGQEPMPVRAPLILRRLGTVTEDGPPDTDISYSASVTMRRPPPDEDADPLVAGPTAPPAAAPRPRTRRTMRSARGLATATAVVMAVAGGGGLAHHLLGASTETSGPAVPSGPSLSSGPPRPATPQAPGPGSPAAGDAPGEAGIPVPARLPQQARTVPPTPVVRGPSPARTTPPGRPTGAPEDQRSAAAPLPASGSRDPGENASARGQRVSGHRGGDRKTHGRRGSDSRRDTEPPRGTGRAGPLTPLDGLIDQLPLLGPGR